MSDTQNRAAPSAPSTADLPRLAALYAGVRRRTLELTEPLTPEDQCIQSMPDTSPTKWHLAHTTWFFETFILKPSLPGYAEYDPAYNFLFNSYYEQVGPRHARPQRGLLSRPPLDDVLAFRAHVDEAMDRLFAAGGLDDAGVADLIELGCHHEQQHQELMLTDIKHVFSCNPLKPAYSLPRPRDARRTRTLDWVEHPGGLVEIGFGADGFHFDCEGPRHRTWLEPFRLASRPVTNGEYLAFMEDGGYDRTELWLSDGIARVREMGWRAPLYWEPGADGVWRIFTLSGLRPIDPDAPVCHVSFYEADAYARWAGKRLPTEAEWEVVAAPLTPAGNFAGSGEHHPVPARGEGLRQVYGDVWEWTASSYRPYRGFQAAQGAVGEYNGKFMSGQMVLRGGSCVTPEGHVRPTYRNFFYPPDRWQFSGIRLAEDLAEAAVPAPDLADMPVADAPPEDPMTRAFLNDVVMGLSDTPKGLPPKWFYDDKGAALFEDICRTPEYYPTETERGILQGAAADIAGLLGPGAVLVEFGSGAMEKVRIILDALADPGAFVAVDISVEQLAEAADQLRADYPDLHVVTLAGDFTKPLALPDDLAAAGRRCAFLPGSTIGNFEPHAALGLLERLRDDAGPGGALVIGVDLQKDVGVLEAAYNDAAGVTAAFNLNLLARINRELGGDADLDGFAHRAFYNDAEGRIEMHLVSARAQTFQVGGHAFSFAEGETIHTENSYKFTPDGFEALARRAGFALAHCWTDADERFAVMLLDVVDAN
ncbi:MAG: ergothioneine biosynthesis protein EgtB [Rhodospirillaceae bacterium]